MLDDQSQPLYKTTIDELAASVQAWAPYVAGYAVIFTMLHYVLHCPDADSFLKAKHDLILTTQLVSQAAPFSWATLILWFISVYVLSVVCLRHAIPKNPPRPSIGGFFIWLKYCLIRFLRPLVWILLPVICIFFYIRSLVRRSIVTPMAILGHPDITQKSWDMTNGMAWHIFKQGLTLNVVLWITFFIASFGLGLIEGIVSAVTGPHGAVVVALFKSAVSSLFSGVSIMANAIFACITYRAVLKGYKKTQQTSTSLPN